MADAAPIVDPELSVSPFESAWSSGQASIWLVAVGDAGQLGEMAKSIDESWGGSISRYLELESEFKGKRGQTRWLTSPPDAPPMEILLVGCGGDSDKKKTPTDTARLDAFELSATAVRVAVSRKPKHITNVMAEAFEGDAVDALVSGCLAGLDGQGIYKTKDDPPVPTHVVWVGMDEAAMDRGQKIGLAINHTRRLVNAPASEINPITFAERNVEMAKAVGLESEVWDEKKLEAEGCRAMLAVGRASATPPRLLMLSHHGGNEGDPPLAIVGKGVTFDSGGLSLKPSDAMMDMKCDMAGAATVVGVMQAIATLGIKKNVIGMCGLAENMIAGDAYRLGDVIKTRSGKTIEIHNTDAEGRVVLSDTLDVTVEKKPKAIVDLATLTGACMVALGNEVAGLMANNHDVQSAIIDAARVEGEYVWPLPMFPLFDEKVKSKVADIKNVGNGRWGGAITAAKFLENFVQEVPWCHIDIAGPAFADSPEPYRDAGATGALVRTLIRWIESS